MRNSRSKSDQLRYGICSQQNTIYWVVILLLGIYVLYEVITSNQPYWQTNMPSQIKLEDDFIFKPFERVQIPQLRNHRGKGVVLNFWASWCYPCRKEIPILQSVWQQYQYHNIVVLGVNVWDKQADALDFLNEVGVTYPNSQDSDVQLAEFFKVQGLPTTLFIAPDGTHHNTILGPLTYETLTKEIAMITPQTIVPSNQHNSILDTLYLYK